MFKRFLTFLRRLFFTLGMVGAIGMILPRLITSIYSMNGSIRRRMLQQNDLPLCSAPGSAAMERRPRSCETG
ncbi:MAG: hypothetical protein U0V48_03430 [Anaerolineales bacterium]